MVPTSGYEHYCVDSSGNNVCEIECVSEIFDVEVAGGEASISVVGSAPAGWTGPGSAITERPDRFVVPTQIKGYDIGPANCAVTPGSSNCGNWEGAKVRVRVTDSDGGGIGERLVRPEVLHFPPTIEFDVLQVSADEVSKTYTCPSTMYPKCYFNKLNGVIVTTRDAPTSASADPAGYLSSKQHMFHIFSPFLIVRQDLAGTDADGYATMDFIFPHGNPGEYTVIFGAGGSGVSYSKPVTMFVENELDAITIVSEPMASELVNATAPGERYPSPTVSMLKANGDPLRYYRAAATFVDDDGNVAPILLDIGSTPYENLIGLALTRPSASNGYANMQYPIAVDAVDGCYRMKFSMYHCGVDGSACPSAAYATGGYNTKGVTSAVTTSKWCFTNAGAVISFAEEPSDVATPAVPLASSPKLQLTANFENILMDTLGIAVFLVVPYSLKQSADFADVLGVLQLNKCNVDINSLENAACDFNVENASSVLTERLDQELTGNTDSASTFYNEEVVPASLRWLYAQATLAGNLCVYKNFKPIFGPCTSRMTKQKIEPSEFSRYDRYVSGRLNTEYKYNATFEGFSWNKGLNGALLQLQAARPLHAFFPSNPLVYSLNEDAPTSKIQLRLEPTDIHIALQPRRFIAVGDLFEVRVKVTIGSGTPLPFTTVTPTSLAASAR